MYRRLMLLGDTHGNQAWVKRIFKTAKYMRVDAIVQLGDFGAGFNVDVEGDQFVRYVKNQVVKSEVPFYFIEGNHDDQSLLFKSSKPDGPFRRFVEDVPFWFIPRGAMWEWNGVSFMGMGGAVSIDRKHRTPGKSWWHTEQVTLADLELVEDVEHVDVLLTHDTFYNPSNRSQYKDDPESTAHQLLLRDLVKQVKPEFNFHGHWHFAYDRNVRVTEDLDVHTVGLGCDGDYYCYALFHLPEKRVEWQGRGPEHHDYQVSGPRQFHNLERVYAKDDPRRQGPIL